jgi:hypothetical protein
MSEYGVGESAFREICGECREFKEWCGPRKRRWLRCGCNPEPPAKAGKNTRKVGDRLEKAVAKGLIGAGSDVRFQPGSGAVGSRDASISKMGDHVLTIHGTRWTGESKKRAAGPCKTLDKWLGPCDWLAMQADGRRLYVMTEEMFHAITRE